MYEIRGKIHSAIKSGDSLAVLGMTCLLCLVILIIINSVPVCGPVKKTINQCIFCPDSLKDYAEDVSGENYLLNLPKYSPTLTSPTDCKAEACIFSGWHLLHFIQYAILAFLCPERIELLLSVGLLFEIVEYVLYHCESLLDLFYNTSGVAVGVILRYVLWPL